jgi:hypothetical protein
MTLRNIYFFVIGLWLLNGCTNNPLKIDASNINVDIAFINVDSLLVNTDSLELIKAHNRLKSEINEIYLFEIGNCLRIGDVEDTAFYNSIKKFKEDTSIENLEKHIKNAFVEKAIIENRIVDGFKHLKYHFPNGKIPKHVVYLNTLFSVGVYCTENDIGVGLERFLGDSNEIIQQLNPQFHYAWMKKAMDAKYLERDVLTGWIATHYIDEVNGNLAENIMRWGKIIYLTEASFPEDPPEIIIRYTPEEYTWALENEYQFWQYLVDEKLLFKIDDRTKMNMLSEGPFTPGLPDQEGPDRLGQFIGWRMVKKYMEKNEITLKEMVSLPYNNILQEYEID